MSTGEDASIREWEREWRASRHSSARALGVDGVPTVRVLRGCLEAGTPSSFLPFSSPAVHRLGFDERDARPPRAGR